MVSRYYWAISVVVWIGMFATCVGQLEEEPCPRGFFGADCENVCHCKASSEQCARYTGICKSGCADGFTGKSCHKNNTAGFHIPQKWIVITGAVVGVLLTLGVIGGGVYYWKLRKAGKRVTRDTSDDGDLISKHHEEDDMTRSAIWAEYQQQDKEGSVEKADIKSLIRSLILDSRDPDAESESLKRPKPRDRTKQTWIRRGPRPTSLHLIVGDRYDSSGRSTYSRTGDTIERTGNIGENSRGKQSHKKRDKKDKLDRRHRDKSSISPTPSKDVAAKKRMFKRFYTGKHGRRRYTTESSGGESTTGADVMHKGGRSRSGSRSRVDGNTSPSPGPSGQGTDVEITSIGGQTDTVDKVVEISGVVKDHTGSMRGRYKPLNIMGSSVQSDAQLGAQSASNPGSLTGVHPGIHPPNVRPIYSPEQVVSMSRVTHPHYKGYPTPMPNSTMQMPGHRVPQFTPYPTPSYTGNPVAYRPHMQHYRHPRHTPSTSPPPQTQPPATADVAQVSGTPPVIDGNIHQMDTRPANTPPSPQTAVKVRSIKRRKHRRHTSTTTDYE